MLENQSNNLKENQLDINKMDSMSEKERMEVILKLGNKSMDEHQSLYEKLAQ